MRSIYDLCSRFGLLTIERIDFAPGEHIGEHEVLEHLNTLWRSSLVVIAEGLEEIFARFVPLF